MTLLNRHIRAFTLTELIVASALSALAGIGMMSLFVYSGRIGRSITIQQRSIQEARAAIEGINQAVRPAIVPLRVLNDAGSVAPSGDTVELAWQGEPLGQRNIRLLSADASLQTPWDNTLVYDPNTTRFGDEVVLARWVTALPGQNIFTYDGSDTSLKIRLRVGDSLGDGMTDINNSRSGPGFQGVDVTVTVAPRN